MDNDIITYLNNPLKFEWFTLGWESLTLREQNEIEAEIYDIADDMLGHPSQLELDNAADAGYSDGYDDGADETCEMLAKMTIKEFEEWKSK